MAKPKNKAAVKAFLGLVFVLTSSFSAISGGIWLKASAGLATFGGGDYNRGVVGANDLYRMIYSNVNGVFSKLDRGLDLALEIGYPLSSRLSLGLGVGYLQTREEDTVEFDWKGGPAAFHDRISAKPFFQAIPLMVNIRYSLPVWKIRLNFMAGAGTYLCRFRYDQDYRTTQFDWNYSYAFKASEAIPAVHGGLGLEVPLSRRLSFVLDVEGRFARANEIEGDWTLSGSLEGLAYSESGKNHYFWRYDFKSGDLLYPLTSFQEFKPTNPSITGARKGRFDFGGFVASAGFRINL
ncbi:MAG: hypothetical protein ACYDH3_04970 [Candidatus Aminicenantales bacterium]